MIDNLIGLVVKELRFSMDENSLIDNLIALVMKELRFSMDENSLIDNLIGLVVKELRFSMDEVILVKKADLAEMLHRLVVEVAAKKWSDRILSRSDRTPYF